jgi:hypothetical protein
VIAFGRWFPLFFHIWKKTCSSYKRSFSLLEIRSEWEDSCQIIISMTMNLQGSHEFGFNLSPLDNSTFTLQPLSDLPSNSQRASPESPNSTKAKLGDFVATHTLQSDP